LVNKKGNEDIVRHRVEIGHKNKEDVYNAVHKLTSNDNIDSKEKVRLEEIWNYLEEITKRDNEEMKSIARGIYESERGGWTSTDLDKAIKKGTKRTISIRTIQRCIDKDPRIKKDAWYFYIDDEARFEKRYLHPSFEGEMTYKEFRENMSYYYYNALESRNPPIEDEMNHLVTEIGFFVVYSLIDACRPFRDKSMSLDDREDLVRYWIKNSIPISNMLDEFLDLFKPDYMDDLYNHYEAKGKKKGLSVLEMDEETIQNTLTMLQKQYPLQFKMMVKSSDPDGGKKMSPFQYKDGNLIHPKKERQRKNV
jgi:hypothetical protein